jgi:hypothetical protein
VTLFAPSNRQRLARWLLWSALAIHAPIALVAALKSKLPQGDFDNYYSIGTRPGRPYVDFPVEFPIGTTQAFRTLAPMAGSRVQFGIDLVILNIVADISIAATLYWGWGIEAAAGYAIVVAPLLDLFLIRTDLWSTALATFGVAAWRRRRPSLAAIGFASGAAFKLWPVTFLPLLLVPGPSRNRMATLATAAAAGMAILAWWLWVAGPLGLYQVLTFRGARGWELESTVGGVWMIFDRNSIRHESGAWRVGTTIAPISIALFVVGTAISLWMVWRGGRTRHLGAGWAGGVGALLALSALLSPQFACWLAPAAGVAWVEGDLQIAALTMLTVFLTNLEFKSFGPLMRGEQGALTLVLARNLLLVLLVLDAARLVARAPQTPAAPDDQLPA